jgi:hypothetical protein
MERLERLEGLFTLNLEPLNIEPAKAVVTLEVQYFSALTSFAILRCFGGSRNEKTKIQCRISMNGTTATRHKRSSRRKV